mmetsp:Transcript_24972/g.48530  ORF Transcript_24972/g.48530 Transcript_24972/m.48530 type:complete len:215 (-) Transcript_24972:1751-2395(-)
MAHEYSSIISSRVSVRSSRDGLGGSKCAMTSVADGRLAASCSRSISTRPPSLGLFALHSRTVVLTRSWLNAKIPTPHLDTMLTPVSSSLSMHPTAHISSLYVYAFAPAFSGDAYVRVPARVPASFADVMHARPKSVILTSSWFCVKSTLSGFMSLWIIFLEWMCCSASQSCAISLVTASSPRGPFVATLLTRLDQVPPVASSITMQKKRPFLCM